MFSTCETCGWLRTRRVAARVNLMLKCVHQSSRTGTSVLILAGSNSFGQSVSDVVCKSSCDICKEFGSSMLDCVRLCDTFFFIQLLENLQLHPHINHKAFYIQFFLICFTYRDKQLSVTANTHFHKFSIGFLKVFEHIHKIWIFCWFAS